MDRLARLASFTLPANPDTIEGDFVLRSGLIFRAGDYPDKEFSMTPAELAEAVEAFEPCAVDLEHTDTVLSGKLGQLEQIALSEDGTGLNGVVRLPKWLDDAIGVGERKVSATWDRATKKLLGLALVLSPRVPDAALMSAYAAFTAAHPDANVDFVAPRHDTPPGQSALQRLHDIAADSGATCAKPKAAAMSSKHELDAIQSIHDTAVANGATCVAIKPTDYPVSSYPVGYGATATGATVSAPPLDVAPATTPPAVPAATAPAAAAATTTPPKEGRSMSWKDKLLAAISGMPDTDDEAPPAAPGAPAAPAAPAPAVAMATEPVALTEARRLADAQRGRAEAAEAENRRLVAERIQERAIAFADKALAESRALPAEREAIISDYMQRATDDTLYGTVNFGPEGKTTTRIGLLEAAFAAREPHKLTAAQVAPALLSLLQGHRDTPAQDAGEREATPEEVRKLISLTPAGAAYLSEARRTAPSADTSGR
jgi:hypothetical protein